MPSLPSMTSQARCPPPSSGKWHDADAHPPDQGYTVFPPPLQRAWRAVWIWRPCFGSRDHLPRVQCLQLPTNQSPTPPSRSSPPRDEEAVMKFGVKMLASEDGLASRLSKNTAGRSPPRCHPDPSSTTRGNETTLRPHSFVCQAMPTRAGAALAAGIILATAASVHSFGAPVGYAGAGSPLRAFQSSGSSVFAARPPAGRKGSIVAGECLTGRSKASRSSLLVSVGRKFYADQFLSSRAHLSPRCRLSAADIGCHPPIPKSLVVGCGLVACTSCNPYLEQVQRRRGSRCEQYSNGQEEQKDSRIATAS